MHWSARRRGLRTTSVPRPLTGPCSHRPTPSGEAVTHAHSLPAHWPCHAPWAASQMIGGGAYRAAPYTRHPPMSNSEAHACRKVRALAGGPQAAACSQGRHLECPWLQCPATFSTAARPAQGPSRNRRQPFKRRGPRLSTHTQHCVLVAGVAPGAPCPHGTCHGATLAACALQSRSQLDERRATMLPRA